MFEIRTFNSQLAHYRNKLFMENGWPFHLFSNIVFGIIWISSGLSSLFGCLLTLPSCNMLPKCLQLLQPYRFNEVIASTMCYSFHNNTCFAICGHHYTWIIHKMEKNGEVRSHCRILKISFYLVVAFLSPLVSIKNLSARCNILYSSFTWTFLKMKYFKCNYLVLNVILAFKEVRFWM